MSVQSTTGQSRPSQSSDAVQNYLDPNSFTAQRLKHASPEHLHVTTRRFFIGPIPEGWLNSNRKSWYKRRLELHNFSSREATFDAAQQARHKKTLSLSAQPSLAARVAVSFPQPTDIWSAPTTPGTVNNPEINEPQSDEDGDTDSDEDVGTTAIAPVSTADTGQFLGISGIRNTSASRLSPVSRNDEMQGIDEVLQHDTFSGKSLRAESFTTARENATMSLRAASPVAENLADNEGNGASEGELRPSTSIRTGVSSHLHVDGMQESPDNVDSSSKTALLSHDTPLSSPQSNIQSATMSPKSIGQRSMARQSPAPLKSPSSPGPWNQRAPGVRFKVAEGVADRRHRLGRRANNARNLVASKTTRRETLREGTVIKMERMLVRIDVTMQKLPDDYDENESVKTETRPLEKWREFMIVARKAKTQDGGDFRLQLYKTRVIPENDNEESKKKPAREIKLLPKTTRVNLFSSLDKTIVIWHPYRKGTRIFIMKPNSTAHAVEWYTFIRDALGSVRPTNLQVNVPDLDVALHVERPFEILASAALEETDERMFLAKAAAAEQAVAGRIISQSMDMLAGDPEWSQVLQKWSETANMGLAWKRYDRLEWIYGVNEKKMYGSMAMQHSYDLELRPKQHYPTEARGKKGTLHEEPAPVEGFLIRLTSRKGMHKRFGKAFFKRLYFSTHDNFLVFNRPAKATPPHPPRLATVIGTNIPSSGEIVRQTPTMFEIDPFELEDHAIKWLKPNRQETSRQNDVEAQEESLRNLRNLAESDGYVNLCQVIKIRPLKWGAHEGDEALDSGSDVDFHVDVDNTTHEDGTTTEIDDDRTFELVLQNHLVVRLQAYDKETRNEWMRRLRKLVKYWRLRTTADVVNLKSVKNLNLNNLNIDEEMEARIGQFARKWEVSRSEASPELYNMCRLAGCRAITMSGMLYRKPKRHGTFHRCGVFLSGGQMLIYQAALRKRTGEQVPHIHQEKQEVVDLKDCYCYSGLIVEEDLLYQNRTFDANQPGMLAATPRVYPTDGWTAADVDVMTCFVIWMNRRKGWFRSVTSGDSSSNDQSSSQRSKLTRVAQLGVPGRSMVFKCRSRAERDLWVTSVAAAIETAVEKAHHQQEMKGRGDLGDVRLQH